MIARKPAVLRESELSMLPAPHNECLVALKAEFSPGMRTLDHLEPDPGGFGEFLSRIPIHGTFQLKVVIFRWSADLFLPL
jgi:hypothetical protein